MDNPDLKRLKRVKRYIRRKKQRSKKHLEPMLGETPPATPSAGNSEVSTITFYSEEGRSAILHDIPMEWRESNNIFLLDDSGEVKLLPIFEDVEDLYTLNYQETLDVMENWNVQEMTSEGDNLEIQNEEEVSLQTENLTCPPTPEIHWSETEGAGPPTTNKGSKRVKGRKEKRKKKGSV